jgi:hypothetical protein
VAICCYCDRVDHQIDYDQQIDFDHADLGRAALNDCGCVIVCVDDHVIVNVTESTIFDVLSLGLVLNVLKTMMSEEVEHV